MSCHGCQRSLPLPECLRCGELLQTAEELARFTCATCRLGDALANLAAREDPDFRPYLWDLE